jgi:hypothetical protein
MRKIQCYGSGIRTSSGVFLTPGSGMGKKSGFESSIRIRDEQPGSHFRELISHFWRLKYLSSLMGIRDGKNSDPGSGKIRIRDREKSDQGSGINIPDPQHWKNSLLFCSVPGWRGATVPLGGLALGDGRHQPPRHPCKGPWAAPPQLPQSPAAHPRQVPGKDGRGNCSDERGGPGGDFT